MSLGILLVGSWGMCCRVVVLLDRGVIVVVAFGLRVIKYFTWSVSASITLRLSLGLGVQISDNVMIVVISSYHGLNKIFVILNFFMS